MSRWSQAGTPGPPPSIAHPASPTAVTVSATSLPSALPRRPGHATGPVQSGPPAAGPAGSALPAEGNPDAGGAAPGQGSDGRDAVAGPVKLDHPHLHLAGYVGPGRRPQGNPLPPEGGVDG